MYALAEASDRLTIEEYARTYENRPLVLLTITSEANHNSIETIRETHLSLLDPDRSGSANIEEMPAVVLLGHSVHGNEPSGANASMLAAYHFVAGEGRSEEHTSELQ